MSTLTQTTQHPILFSTPMVQAILEGRKTMTRRIIKPQPTESWMKNVVLNYPDCKMFDRKGDQRFWLSKGSEAGEIKFPYGKVGDILWVREMLYQSGELGLEYVADKEDVPEEVIPNDYPSYRNYAFCNIPSIHMPKWACRLFLRITDVRVERLQDISEEDAKAEGARYQNDAISYDGEHYRGSYKNGFRSLWQSINSIESWQSNPWVFVIEFERIEKPV
jgi:hypothetical protein